MYTHDTYTHRDKDFDCDEYAKRSKYKGGNCFHGHDCYEKERDIDYDSDSDKDYKKLDIKRNRHYRGHCPDLDSYSHSERNKVHGYCSMSTTHHSKDQRTSNVSQCYNRYDWYPQEKVKDMESYSHWSHYSHSP